MQTYYNESFKKEDFNYTSLFCEENIWHLAHSLINQGFSEKNLSILFLTNPTQEIAVFEQLSAAKNEPVIWDYHVLLLLKNHFSKSDQSSSREDLIFDFDSRLGFVTPTNQYLQYSFPSIIPDKYQCYFRVIPSTLFLQSFDSDRQHMQGVISANQYPPYAAIKTQHSYTLRLTTLLNISNPIKDCQLFSHVASLNQWLNISEQTI